MINQNLLLTGDDGYNLTKSLRFRSSAGASLSRTPSVAGNQQTWTWSGWFKRGILSSTQPAIFSCGTYPTNLFQVIFDNGSTADIINITNYPNSTTPNLDLRTTQVFRDPSSWYHIIIATDTTQATNANRVKLYINGVQVTAFGTATYPAQNASLNINNNGITNNIGNRPTNSNPFDGYMTEINFIDGQALTPSSFGSTNALTGVWQPAKYTGTYGTNGFYLPFTNTTSTSTLGNDFSGNSNTWTVNNISLTTGSTYDSMTDVPTLTSATTANYSVLNPVYKSASQPTISSGNLEVAPNAGTYQNAFSTIAITTGKWYCELLVTGTPNSANFIGISNQTQLNYLTQTANVIGATTGVGYSFYPANGDKYTNGTQTSYGTSVSSGDIVGIAVDLDNGKIWFSKNGTWQASGDPAAGTNAAFTGIASDLWSIGATVYSGGVTNFAFNFGQRPFSYTAPTGFVALNTFNLPTSTIVNGGKCMDATIYTGDGSQTKSFTNTFGFKPDLVWSKIRSGTTQGTGVFDSVRGTTGQSLDTASTSAEGTWNSALSSEYGYVSAFNSNGFSVDDGSVATTGGYVNYSGRTYVAWQWQAGQGTTSSNTSGSITSTVSVNATAGFSIVTYNTGAAGNQTVGHGLGVTPAMIIIKSRVSTTAHWDVWHKSFANPAQGYMYLNLTNAVANDARNWANTAPTSTVFSYESGYEFTANQNYVAYCWAEIAGFSKFGSYTGNGSSDGPFVYLGFRPRFIMFQCTTAGSNWTIVDTARSTYNAAVLALQPNVSSAENNYANYDFLSNGFKIRGTLTNEYNVSGQTYIYAAFAENPFKNALAR